MKVVPLIAYISFHVSVNLHKMAPLTAVLFAWLIQSWLIQSWLIQLWLIQPCVCLCMHCLIYLFTPVFPGVYYCFNMVVIVLTLVFSSLVINLAKGPKNRMKPVPRWLSVVSLHRLVLPGKRKSVAVKPLMAFRHFCLEVTLVFVLLQPLNGETA